jgi:hypothetical protein
MVEHRAVFFSAQLEQDRDRYEKLLQIIGALSKLSSSQDIPYLYYRMAEDIFCKAFGADNLARSDIPLDAKKNGIGIGLKTFVCKTTSAVEKIAEFNRERKSIDEAVSETEKIKRISLLRNKRLGLASNMCNVPANNMLYHCVSRKKGKFIISETDMAPINIDNIKIDKGKTSKNVVIFQDGLNEYRFNFSKSTLYKRFIINPIHEIDIRVLDEPYKILEDCLKSELLSKEPTSISPIIGTICLPLYSNRGDNKQVPERSGLNQWNANGRQRNLNEVYIPIPKEIHKSFPNFFPARDTPFTLFLPSGEHLMAKICQDSGKALMSNPNRALGKWLLRDVLKLNEAELLTYQKLEEIAIDSIEINKLSDNSYEINFKKIDTYEDFKARELSAGGATTVNRM